MSDMTPQVPQVPPGHVPEAPPGQVPPMQDAPPQAVHSQVAPEPGAVAISVQTLDRPVTQHSIPAGRDNRGSWIPPWRMVTAKFLELRKRRGMMIAVLILTLGILILVDGIFLILHAAAPNSYGPAGGLQKYRGFCLIFVQTFGIAAVLIGAAAGSTDLSDGVFRHLVGTGRSRFAIFMAKVPAGLMVILPVTALTYALEAIVGAVFAPSGPVREFSTQVVTHNGSTISLPHSVLIPAAPSVHLMILVGLWLMLQVVVAFIIGLGLGALIGSRSATIAILIAVQLIVTPILSGVVIPHLINLQRAFVGLALAQLEPSGLTGFGDGGGGGNGGVLLTIPFMPSFGLAIVIAAWVVGWLALGAWRTAKRDA